MEYCQERIATLHEFGEGDGVGGALTRDVAAAVAETALVVPMTAREYKSPATERVLEEMERLEPTPAAVFVPIRAEQAQIEPFRDWLATFELPTRVLWCNAPEVDALLADTGLAGNWGKGRDVWLALGPAAAAADTVVVHDADAKSYEAEHVQRLLAPLTMDFDFAKGYYARIERGRLYGRLFRLFYEPLLRALADAHDAPIVDYLGAFRYALAGEFAATADLARRLQTPRTWGLEVGTLGDAYDVAGFDGTAQVDLGRHEHDHRVVDGEAGLEGMSRDVAAALLCVLEDHGVAPDYETLPDRYRAAGTALIEQYRADAAFNGLEYDLEGERAQVTRYAESIAPPDATTDMRLPRWVDAPFEPADVLAATRPWRHHHAGSRSQD
ncbi:glucosyl-3-phosphoglycerate synthase [Natrinema hispanicum]|uniref:Glucosyl-3-phosphoglycerate synthase n=1 Tax=Natrinema hispanicum TaxID=392421 RepID=A0A482YAU8_9EURY|nr:glycosyl transferase family 2 [Natrinema hispanicum]RZV12433.1 glucosyl-3-phosphoglycerate synthase [Natrinema hispanicum]